MILQPGLPSLCIWMLSLLSWDSVQHCFSSRSSFHSEGNTAVGFCLWNQLVLPHAPSPRSSWPNWKLEWLNEDSVVVPVGRQHPETMRLCLTGYSTCFGTESVIWCSLLEPEHVNLGIMGWKQKWILPLLNSITLLQNFSFCLSNFEQCLFGSHCPQGRNASTSRYNGSIE